LENENFIDCLKPDDDEVTVMNLKSTHTLRRVALVSLTLLFAVLIVFNLFRFAQTPHDENFFRTAPGQLYVMSSLLPTPDETPMPQRGDLLTSLNGEPLTDSLSFVSRLAAFSDTAHVQVNYFRTGDGKRYSQMMTKELLLRLPIVEIPKSVYIISVLPNGASDRAGMKTGDLIFRINNTVFQNEAEADLIMRRGGVGRTILYEGIRDGAVRHFDVTLSSFGIQTSLVLVVLASLITMGIGLFVAAKRPADKIALLLGIGFIGVGAFVGLIRLQRDFVVDWFVLLRNIILIGGGAFGAAMLAHARLYFPKPSEKLLSYKVLRRIPYLIAAMVCIGVAVFSPHFLSIIPLLIFGYNSAARLSKKSDAPRDARRSNQLYARAHHISIAAFVIAAVGFVMQSGSTVWLDLAFASTVLMPFMALYLIARYRIFDIDIRVKRTIQYTAISILWTIGLVTLFVTLIAELASLSLNIPNVRLTFTYIDITDGSDGSGKTIEKFLFMVFTIAIGVVFWKINVAFQNWLDKKFYREGYDYRRAAAELSEALTNTLNLNTLTSNAAKKLYELMRLKSIGVIVFPHKVSRCVVKGFGMRNDEWRSAFKSTPDVIKETLAAVIPDTRIPVSLLPKRVQETIANTGFVFSVPIRSQDHLLGAIFIGEKLSDEPLHDEDFRFLTAAARQMAVSIENALLHEETTQQERFKHELDLAREIQLSSLPGESPSVAGLDVSGVSIPALEVGGDFFDFLQPVTQRNELTVIVGDVSGKGTSAALYMSKVQGILRSLYTFDLAPRELFVRTNDLLRKDLSRSSFVTAVAATFEPSIQSVAIARAGHLPVFYWNARTRKATCIKPKGIGLGLTGKAKFSESLEELRLTYHDRDVFLFISDGILDARNERGDEFGEARLLQILEQHAASDSPDLRAKILNEVILFSNSTPQYDDQTLVIVRAIL
jgi:phosphoserine phosphatase RsbU/P